ncbi:flagellar protein FliT [Brevibacillus invocatus]|uniref:Flagellar protein FliT n=1 Tax=Brevibacillus invocatus TaxID=173959 RepID=A0A3M8CMZ2_9BACL|nr:flagellar protein FliT [Brevibacillus invocatus]RNB77106.1 flagellar protein FliT [Brevibacillus invocatus]
MNQSVDALLDRLLEATLRLEQAVTHTESDPDEWLAILDERDELISKIQDSTLTSSTASDLQREKLTKIYDVNQRLIPLMDKQKQGVQNQLNKVQRSKQAMHSYNDEGPSGYGAFFDRKN